MSQIRLYLDEDAGSRSLAREFRARGIDVATAASERMLGESDESQVELPARKVASSTRLMLATITKFTPNT
jgi:hypothetical protein